MTDDRTKDRIDVELQGLGRALAGAVERSSKISGAKSSIVSDAVHAFQNAQQNEPERSGVSLSWFLRLGATATATVCLALLILQSRQVPHGPSVNSLEGEYAMDDLAFSLHYFSEDFASDFTTAEPLAEVSYDVSTLDDLEAGFIDTTTLEDFSDEFEAV